VKNWGLELGLVQLGSDLGLRLGLVIVIRRSGVWVDRPIAAVSK